MKSPTYNLYKLNCSSNDGLAVCCFRFAFEAKEQNIRMHKMKCGNGVCCSGETTWNNTALVWTVRSLYCEAFTVAKWADSCYPARHQTQVRLWSYSPSSISCGGSGTRSWSGARWGRAHARSRSVSFASGTGWSGTPFPARESGTGYKFAVLASFLKWDNETC